MARTSPVHYIAPSAISITPNANGSHRDLAVYVAKGAKIKVLCPRAGIDYVGNEYQEWTLSGRNRRLADTTGTVPYTIYARLKKTGDKTGYLVFAPRSENGTDKYQYLTLADNAINGITSIDGATTSNSDWYIRLGDVSAAENGQRTVDLDTGILGTGQYNEKWALNPDLLPLRIELGCTIDDEDAGPTPYVYWGQQLVLTATLTEGWTGTDIKRFDHWEITRDSGDSDADNAWNHPIGSGIYRGLTDGQITLTHARGYGDDFNGAVSATFTVVAMGHPEEGSESQDLVVLKTAVINIHAETVERYELVMTANIVGYNPMTQTYAPASIAILIRATDQRGDVFELTNGQYDNAGLEVQYAAVGSSGWRTLDFTGASDVVGTATLITATAFAAQQSINVRLVRIIDTDGGSSETELTQQTIAFVRDGEDSPEREWIYLRSTDAVTFGTVQNPYPADVTGGEVNPPGTAGGTDTDKNQDGWVPEGWTDERLGADDTYRYEYSSYRDYVRGGDSSSSGDVGGWGPFSEPRVQSHWGADGKTSVRIDLDNPHEDFLYSDDSDNTLGGRVSGPVTTQARLYDGGEPVTAGVDFRIDSSLSEGVVLQNSQSPYFAWVDNAGLLTVRGIWKQSSFVTVKAVYGGRSYYAKFTANRSSQDKYSLVLSPNAIAYNPATYATQVVAVAVTRLDIGGTKSDVVFASGGDDFYNPVKISATSGRGLLRLFVTYRKKSGGSVSQVTEQLLSGTFSVTAGTDNVADLNDGIYFELRKYASADAANSSTYKIMDYDTVPITKAEDGDAGVGIASVTKLYALSSYASNAGQDDSSAPYSIYGSWGSTMPVPTDTYKYLWCKETTTYTNATSTTRYYVISVKGKDGSPGSPGSPGIDGFSVVVTPTVVIFNESYDSSTGAASLDTTAVSPTIQIKIGNTAQYITWNSKNDVRCQSSVSGSGTQMLTVSFSSVTAGATEGSVSFIVSTVASSGSTAADGRFSFTVKIPVFVNRLGTFARTIVGGIETAFGSTQTYTPGGLGDIIKNAYEAKIETSAKGLKQEFSEQISRAGDYNMNLFGFHNGCVMASSSYSVVPFIQGYGIVVNRSYYDSGYTRRRGRVSGLPMNGSGGQFVVTFEAKFDNGYSDSLKVDLCDVDGTKGEGSLSSSSVNVYVGTSFSSYEIHFDVPDSKASLAHIDFNAVNNNSGNLYIRHLKIERGTSPTAFCEADEDIAYLGQGQLLSNIQNPFSMMTGGWSIDGSTQTGYSNTITMPSSSSTWNVNGDTNASKDFLYVSNMGGVTEGRIYTLSFWARATNTSKNLYIICRLAGNLTPSSVNFYDIKENTATSIFEGATSDGYTKIALTSSWKQFYVRFYACNNTSSVTAIPLQIRQNDNQSGYNGTVYIAGIELQEGYVIDPTTFSSLVEQTARRISLVQYTGSKKAGFDMQNGKITAVGDSFEWINQSGASILGLDDGGNAEFAGVVKAKQLYHRICLHSGAGDSGIYYPTDVYDGYSEVCTGKADIVYHTAWNQTSSSSGTPDVYLPDPSTCPGMRVELQSFNYSAAQQVNFIVGTRGSMKIILTAHPTGTSNGIVRINAGNEGSIPSQRPVPYGSHYIFYAFQAYIGASSTAEYVWFMIPA